MAALKNQSISITISDLSKAEAAAILAKLGAKVQTEVDDDGDGDDGDDEPKDEKGKGKKDKGKKDKGKKDKGKKDKGKKDKGKKKGSDDLDFEDEEDEIDAEAVRSGLLDFNAAFGKVKTAKLLKKFGAVNKAGKPDVSAIDEDDYSDIMNEIREALEEAE
jgi:hypothetical protein